MKRQFVFSLVLLLVIVLAACAPGPNTAEKTPDAEGRIAGFWLGLWQGLISPVTFLISIFSKGVRLYEVHNNGFWYNLGFVIGAGLFLQGGVLGSRKACKKR
ncbi:MAG: hypothetical protein H6P98_1977 [Candidatus Aminicenantes bacterium]|nr:hypothetical protein [Candidatus Aminicenantes bacterium]